MQHLQHIRSAQRIPRIEDVIMTEADVDLRFQHLFDARNTTTLRISVKAPLQVNIHQWICDKVNAGHFQQTEKTGSIRAVVGMHRRGMAGGHALAHIVAMCQCRNGFNKAGLLIIDFVTVHVDKSVVFLRQSENLMQRLYAIFTREFKVRDRANDVGAQTHGFLQERFTVGIRKNAFLRERDNL